MIRSKQHRFWIIVTLGFLSAMNPFSIDLYLPAFKQIASVLNTTTASLSLTLSSYFIGIAVGQLAYGPLLDRFGRKKPLYAGLALYVLASFGCIFTRTLEGIVVWRFFSAVGGCVATVVSTAMVRDLFTVQESGRIFSLLMLVLGVSPLLAPSVGSVLTVMVGWQAVFVALILIAVFMIISAAFILPVSYVGDRSVGLTPGPIVRDYWQILKQPQFYIYAFTSSASIATLFAYIAASPVMLFTFFKLSVYTYGCVFTLLAAGFIGGSQLNMFLQHRFKTLQILQWSICFQMFFCLLFVCVAWMNFLPLPLVLVLCFFILLCIGCALPNASVLAMAPFAAQAGRASALLSSSQMILGSISSVTLGCITIVTMRPIAVVFALPALMAGIFLYLGRKMPIVLGEEETSEGFAGLH